MYLRIVLNDMKDVSKDFFIRMFMGDGDVPSRQDYYSLPNIINYIHSLKWRMLD